MCIIFCTIIRAVCTSYVTDGKFEVWSGGCVSATDKVAVLGCVAVGYPVITTQWWSGCSKLVSESFPVTYVTESGVYSCFLEWQGMKLEFTFTVNLGMLY